MNQSNRHDGLIKNIRTKRKWIFALSITAMLIVVFASFPMHLVVLDETVVDYKGIHPLITVLLVLLILFCWIIAYGFALTPLVTSMDEECDPQKHMILNAAFYEPKHLDHVFAVDLIYIGNFQEALKYANKMVTGNKPALVCMGLFNKACCEFFLGDFDALKTTVKEFEFAIRKTKANQKNKIAYYRILKSLNLLLAIAEQDEEKINALREIEVWKNSKATQGYVHYLKGVAAYRVGDKENAIYHFVYVKENCEKIIFSKMAEQYLSKLK